MFPNKSGKNLHQALKTEIVARSHAQMANFSFVKLQWGKEDVAFSLHAAPHTFSMSGEQVTDFLDRLGFERSPCAFVDRGECYARWVDDNFDIQAFTNLFDQAYSNLLEAQKDLEKCGFLFEQTEGCGYLFGKYPHDRGYNNWEMSGDGHTSSSKKLLKQNEDSVFHFKFTWLEGHDNGWVIHYRPIHPPLSSEIQSVFQFLGIKEFKQCPEYDFEPCYWRSIAFQSRGDGFFDSNANNAHNWFDAHSDHFSQGIQKLLKANSDIEKTGLRFLPFDKPENRLDIDIGNHIVQPPDSRKKKEKDLNFDVAISFAGTERMYAEQLAGLLNQAGFSVFYDDFYPEYLWGKNLVDIFDEIYRKRSRYCVIFISKEYNNREWTNHERQSAQARMLREKGKEYILPIKVDNTELTGMPPTVGYVPISKGIDKIAEMLIRKLTY
jgi:hypothetical protein